MRALQELREPKPIITNVNADSKAGQITVKIKPQNQMCNSRVKRADRNVKGALP